MFQELGLVAVVGRRLEGSLRSFLFQKNIVGKDAGSIDDGSDDDLRPNRRSVPPDLIMEKNTKKNRECDKHSPSRFHNTTIHPLFYNHTRHLAACCEPTAETPLCTSGP